MALPTSSAGLQPPTMLPLSSAQFAPPAQWETAARPVSPAAQWSTVPTTLPPSFVQSVPPTTLPPSFVQSAPMTQLPPFVQSAPPGQFETVARPLSPPAQWESGARPQWESGARPVSSFGAPVPSVVAQLPAFQPAPLRADAPSPELLRQLDQQSFSDQKSMENADADFMERLENVDPAYLLTLVGAILLALLVLTPVWDATRLVYSFTFVFFNGRMWCFLAICFCIGILAFYILSMVIMVGCGAAEKKTLPSYVYLFTTTITILGLGLLLLAQPLRVDTLTAYNELMMDCNTGPRTEQLTAYYNVLLNLRRQPDCLKKTSVEQCSGFQEQSKTKQIELNYLKQMELQYLCSGFCYQGTPQKPGTKPSSVAAALAALRGDTTHDYVGLLQFDKLTLFQPTLAGEDFSIVQISRDVLQHRPTGNNHAGLGPHHKHTDMKGLFLLAASGHNVSKSAAAWDKVPKGIGDTADNMAATGWMSSYPPTLFTNANYKTTCEGAAARELRFSAGETANLLYLEGAALLIFSIIAGLFQLCGLCKREERVRHVIVSHPDGQPMKQVVL